MRWGTPSTRTPCASGRSTEKISDERLAELTGRWRFAGGVSWCAPPLRFEVDPRLELPTAGAAPRLAQREVERPHRQRRCSLAAGVARR